MPPDTKHTTVEADGVVSREVDDEDQEALRVPISSTRADREGDRFSKEALDDMAEQIREEQPLVFQNHGLAGSWMDAIPYDQAESIGTHFDAEVEEASDGEFDLFAYINPDGTHEEGERMLRQVRDEGQAVKFSVGFGIKSYADRAEVEDNYEGEGRVFQAVDLMENSKVGIPANPDASVQTASAKSDGMAPGFQMHPVFRMLSGEEADGAVATKDGVATDGGEPEESDDAVDELREEVDAIRDSVDALASTVEEALEDDGDDDDDEDDEDDDKDSCDVDTDCPEGEVCLEGECVPEDEVDDEDSASADEDLLERVAELESALDDGTGDAKTGDPTAEDPPVDRDADPDETGGSEPSETNDADDWLNAN